MRVSAGQEELSDANSEGGSELKYRDVEYAVVQGIERQIWKWSVSVDGRFIKGEAATKAETVAEAEPAIERAFGAEKTQPSRPRG
jgi:hypothetical protein